MKRGVRQYLEPLAIIPYVFWGMYFFEDGLNWFVGILGFVLFIIVPCVVAVFWEQL